MGAIGNTIEMAALSIECLAVAVILIATTDGTISFVLKMRQQVADATCRTRSGSVERCCWVWNYWWRPTSFELLRSTDTAKRDDSRRPGRRPHIPELVTDRGDGRALAVEVLIARMYDMNSSSFGERECQPAAASRAN